jgi:hypothetical protein
LSKSRSKAVTEEELLALKSTVSNLITYLERTLDMVDRLSKQVMALSDRVEEMEQAMDSNQPDAKFPIPRRIQ